MKSPKALLIALLMTGIITTTSFAQIAHVLSPGYVGRTEKAYLPSPAYTLGAYGNADPLPGFWTLAPATPVFGGGMAIDQINRRVYSSDGYMIFQESMQRFPPLTPPNPPVPAPVITTLGFTSLLTGMSIDPLNGRLFICDEWSFQVFSPVWPYPPLPGGPVLLPVPHSPFTGMAYDPSDNTLWFCDIQGGVYHTTITGAAIAGEYPINFVPAALTGICVDRSTGAGSFGTIMPPTPIGFTPARPHVWVTDGTNVIEAISSSIVIPLPGAATAYGMAFSADGQFSYGGTGSPSQPYIRQDRPSVNLAPGTKILMEATPPPAGSGRNQHVFLLYDWYPTPGTPFYGGTRRGLANVYGLGLNTTGVMSVNVFVPIPGFSLSFQYVTVEVGGGIGVTVDISDCLTFMSARP